jgi:hypothetical protein
VAGARYGKSKVWAEACGCDTILARRPETTGLRVRRRQTDKGISGKACMFGEISGS